MVIETNQLTKQYDGQFGCRDITLSIPKGIVFGFLGPNGAGKSTFVRTLLGLIKPDRGTGKILGVPISKPESRLKVGYLPELFRYPDWLTGKQLLEFHADLCKMPHSQARHRVRALIDRVELTGSENKKISKYSKGMQQRIGLACALLMDPEVVFLDEPTSALDPIGRQQVREIVTELRDEGKTIFLNSHLLGEIETVCNHVAIIHKGELIVSGEWRKLMFVSPQVEIFIEAPHVDNLWSAIPSAIHTELIGKEGNLENWRVELSHLEEVPRLIHELCNQGALIHQIMPLNPKLEDVFMHWVNKKGKEGALCG